LKLHVLLISWLARPQGAIQNKTKQELVADFSGGVKSEGGDPQARAPKDSPKQPEKVAH